MPISPFRRLTGKFKLSTSFGIGIIKLDIKNPDDSKIVFPAKCKDILDWETINKLTDENPDFKNFIRRVKIDLASNEPRKEKYDKVLDVDELITMLK